ncbi:MAG: glycosyltransferase family 2 protein [Nitrospirota bacterium]
MVSEETKKTPDPTPDFSVVIPIFNEEENIPELYRRLTAVMEKLGSYEIIMVDDGSRDRSWNMIRDLHAEDGRIKGISFSRNFGHHIAVLAGIDHCRGNYTILMDGDLQDQPEEIPGLVEKAKEGYDIVQGIAPRRHAGPLQNLFSRAFHSLFVKISTVDPKTRISLFRCIGRPVVDSIKKLPERSIFLGGIISWVGFSATHKSVTRVPRHAGRSKYHFMKRLALAMNAVTSFSERPLIYIFQLGILVTFFSLCMFSYALFKKFVHGVAILGWTSLIAAIFLSTGLITLSLSIIGLYISKLFIEIKNRPRYIIRATTEE